MRRFIQFLSITIFFVFLSFSIIAETKFEDVRVGNFFKPDSLGPILYKLYIDNTTLGTDKKRKFKKLIDSSFALSKKLVFQFYFENGKISLITFPGPINHRAAFDTILQVRLSIYDSCTNNLKIVGKLVSFGDMEINGQHSGKVANELKRIAASSNYIIFIPSLVTNGDVTTINYSVVPSPTNDSPTICTLQKPTKTIPVNINPSPPRKIN